MAIIENWLKPVVVDLDPFDTELLWERMFRATTVMGWRGVSTEAISLVDIALWDIKGKALCLPVYKLLSGKTKPRIRAYASRLYGPDLDHLREEAAGYVRDGFTAVKQRFSFGPADGIEGMTKNYEMVKAVRETIGPGIELMIDACRSFDATYAIKMIDMVKEFDPVWVEEPVLPHDIPGYVTVRKAVQVPIAGGEHEFTRYGFREWLEKGAADVLQPDANRAGGLTEMVRISALASTWGIPVIPHGGQMHNYHFIAAHMNAPLAEYFPRPKDLGDGNALYWEIVQGEPRAVDGYIELPSRPGLGLELNKEAVERFRIDR
jgi:L-alanine-DL-glutamate epimerase-like enolase superfamily enzyme